MSTPPSAPRVLAAIAMLMAILTASAQESLCNPCVDGPEMLERRNAFTPLNGTVIEGMPRRRIGVGSIAEVLIQLQGRNADASARCSEPLETTLAGTQWLIVDCDRGAGSRELRIHPAGAGEGSRLVLLLEESHIVPVLEEQLLESPADAAYRELLAMSERELDALLRMLREPR